MLYGLIQGIFIWHVSLYRCIHLAKECWESQNGSLSAQSRQRRLSLSLCKKRRSERLHWIWSVVMT